MEDMDEDSRLAAQLQALELMESIERQEMEAQRQNDEEENDALRRY